MSKALAGGAKKNKQSMDPQDAETPSFQDYTVIPTG
jgi:hypothetical protein